MSAQDIQELAGFTACIAHGVLLLAITPDRLPPPLRSMAQGRHRVPIAVCAILLGAVMVLNLVSR